MYGTEMIKFVLLQYLMFLIKDIFISLNYYVIINIYVKPSYYLNAVYTSYYVSSCFISIC